MPAKEREKYGLAAKERVISAYSWQFIGDRYKKLWEEELGNNGLNIRRKGKE